MSAWAVKDRTESWDAVCDRAWAGEPQFVTRGPSQTVVVISYDDYQPTTRNPDLIDKPKCRSALDMIGYGAKFHKLRTTEEWMKELREGEEDLCGALSSANALAS